MSQENPPEASNNIEAEELNGNEHKNGLEKSMENTEKGRVGSDEYLNLEGVGERPNESSLGKYEISTGSGDRENIMGPEYDENSLYTFKEKNTSQPSLHNSEELFQLVDANEKTNPFARVIMKAMQYGQQKGPEGYYTKDDFVYVLLLHPNEGWTVGKAERTFNALLEDGTVRRSYQDNENLHSNPN